MKFEDVKKGELFKLAVLSNFKLEKISSHKAKIFIDSASVDKYHVWDIWPKREVFPTNQSKL